MNPGDSYRRSTVSLSGETSTTGGRRRRINQVILWLLGFTLLFLCSCATLRRDLKLAPATPGAWEQTRFNTANTAFVPGPAVLPEKMIWKAKTGGEVRAELTANRNLIVAAGWDKRLYLFDSHTGKRRSRTEFDGPPTSAVFAGDSLAFALDGRKGRLFFWDISRRTEFWADKAPRAKSPPVRLDDGWLIGTSPGWLIKYDHLGDTLWSRNFNAPLDAKPAVLNERIYLVTGGKKVVCLSLADGESIWEHSSPGGHAGSPAVDGLVYFGSLDSNFYALSIETGEMNWFFHTGGQIFTSPAVDQERVYFGSNDGYFYALDKTSGRLIWKRLAGLVHGSSPAVWGDLVIFGTSDGHLLLVDSATGEIRRQFETRGSIYNAPIVYQNRIYVTDTRRYLYCFGGAGQPTAKIE